ncbi:S46 family peptidase [Elizabethkingia anophelis]|uniref:S46 family peptidase n=1 Tax=Elizabethkingia anophelis TaxID=1117645 RepID=UPI000C9BA4F3|nr:S46 family peptidase [Elizabethkingia anophelis]MCT3757616.1 S46 family peptidase [Elizabethkingia anophelis]MCT3973005.1 S46 family peptidase [Elizabethkingia anophelis]MCT4001480.1 S46 family peptidase [Elizabethkingia anophelis]MCT4015273.1 S46 family peptidase [Elizabethkingia anophelis]MCT4018834.1 S46 family peptidase [Elizabethkingia anophelis]
MKRLFLLLTFMVSFVQMRADEGMWLMMLIKRLNGVDMQKEGLHLTPEEIYSVNNSSMKDAILQFGGGCTAEIVSPKGLIFTNHHCGYGAIAAASTPEKDYLTNGFWAKNNGEEISSKGLSVRFFVRMDDATKRITSKLNNDMSADQRKAIIDAEIKAIQSENSENGKYTVVVKDFFKGNEFYYFVFQDFKDVRLVGTPPSSIGKYGGDTDNWEWPRHTGDFSVFRVYADKNGNPAEYSADNVPLKPKHHLPISLKGNKPGDFAMIVGYPGTTNRYLTSFGIEQMVSKDYPAWVEASKTAMDVMKKHMDKDDATRLAYASNYASVANYWKNRAGTIEAVYKNGTIGDKKEVEKKFQQWAEKAENKAVYGNVLANTDAYYKQISNRNIEKNYGAQFQRNAKYIRNSFQIGDALTSYMKQDASAQAAMKPKLEGAVKQAYEGFNTQLEAEMLSQMASLYQSKVAADVASATVKSVNTSELANIAQSSIFANATSVINFLNNPSAEKLANDKLYKFAAGYIGDNKVLAEKYAKTDEGFQKDSRLFMDGLMKAMPEKKFYPDANSTIRLTYGKIETLPKRADRDYTGIKQNYYTTMEGMIKKYKKGDEEFDLPQGLLDLYKKKDYGMYKDKDGQLHVNFLSNNDITGGNSGSPIIDGYGRLIGLAFDGNSEALSGDIVFEPKLQRTINVDVRYVLWVIDKFAGAKNLISELTLVK